MSLSGNKDVFRTEAFMDLPAMRRGTAIIFSSTEINVKSRETLVLNVASTAKFLLR